ncbi:MAG: hypothetical protein EWV75_16110 [Microcystis wesenbergii Mw_QC_S_20081001_S30D]|jgi:hypothetical protein|uniref:Uncharacterized protein n=1 Tax=Microcystis wesenbergii Mw_QC_S_20081001_S30D TaxID=2486245 RepID=A0A552JEJ2_9CHRO|nr:MAG: hypothetical protein EWV75_16110 [Microcystis wesenbergii Mw_QC_S_20081001_S30D]TRU97486.1 MAG: hypothetical protein EWV73_16685 [Microcystis wesenbergii Mw_QC_B_20070930_S4D]TRV03421.1 MAG: hypothetical protein EWV74_06725 [Microcystis wesenbergii Mw_QC_S_20081001_S30]TRV08966.1 MAG: hypothetical protein EWV89_19675 [Microcystis wesenbergii Mw_QC_B_20070930_S4]
MDVSYYLGLAEKVGAKHSDKKSTVSAIGYCPNASPFKISKRLRFFYLADLCISLLTKLNN